MSEYTTTLTLTKEQWQMLLFSVGYAAGAMVRDQATSKQTTDAVMAIADLLQTQAKFSDIEDEENGDG